MRRRNFEKAMEKAFDASPSEPHRRGMKRRTRAERRPTIWVIAGPNRGGKTAIVGEMIRESGAGYLGPDEATRRAPRTLHAQNERCPPPLDGRGKPARLASCQRSHARGPLQRR